MTWIRILRHITTLPSGEGHPLLSIKKCAQRRLLMQQLWSATEGGRCSKQQTRIPQPISDSTRLAHNEASTMQSRKRFGVADRGACEHLAEQALCQIRHRSSCCSLLNVKTFTAENAQEGTRSKAAPISSAGHGGLSGNRVCNLGFSGQFERARMNKHVYHNPAFEPSRVRVNEGHSCHNENGDADLEHEQ